MRIDDAACGSWPSARREFDGLGEARSRGVERPNARFRQRRVAHVEALDRSRSGAGRARVDQHDRRRAARIRARNDGRFAVALDHLDIRR